MPSASSPSVQRLLRILLTVAVFSPAVFTAHLVWTHAVDVGTWDMWENAPLLQKWHDGTLTWHDLYAAQIQHRIVVPRLLILALTHLSGGDFRWEQYASFALVAISSGLVWALLNRTLGGSPWQWPIMFAFNLLIFSPMHYQQFLWGSSMWSLIPMPCLLGAILVLTPRQTAKRPWARLAVAVAAAEVATHSFAHGLAIWPVIVGILVVNQDFGNLQKRLILAGAASAIALVTIACYFTDFVNVAWHAYDLKPGDHALSGGKSLLADGNIHIAVRFFFAFLGTWFARTPFVDHPLGAAVVLGQVTLLALLGLAAFTVRHRLWRIALPWLALMTYVLLVGVMVSKRGADIGEHRAVTPRYLAISQYLLISGIATAATVGVVFGRAWKRLQAQHPEHAQGPGSVAQVAPIVLLTAFCTAQIPVWQYGLHFTDVWYQARRQAQALLLFLPHLQDQGRLVSMEVLDKESAGWHCINAVKTLQGLGLLRTKPLERPVLDGFKRGSPLPAGKADLTAGEVTADGTVELKGHARFNVGQPVDAILIVQRGRVISLGQPSPRHVLRIYGLDYEFSNVTDVQVQEMYPWQAQVKLPTLEEPIELWALDVKERRISRVAGNVVLHPSTGRVEIEGRGEVARPH